MMSPLTNAAHHLLRAAVAMLLPLLLGSCQLVTDDYDDTTTPDTAAQYINITISVSTGSTPLTRAPQGGEYGDGTEKGNERENAVSNITLIFYQDNAGINTTSNAAEVLCVKRYDVHPYDPATMPDRHTHPADEPASVRLNEVLYTTGEQRLEETTLVPGETYKVLVVANADIAVSTGDRISDVRDKLAATVYTGTGKGTDDTFVMASESDAAISLTNPYVYTSATEAEKNRFVYYFECIHMERLAARIDYCTNGATYDNTHNGYKYPATGDAFYLVTKVTPFNLYNGDEYLFKRVSSTWSGTTPAPPTYLADETTTNYVVDPATAGKTATATPDYYLSPIAEDIIGSTFTQAMSSATPFTDDDGSNTITIAYAKENTLMPTSPLKKYATGLAFEVKYYASATATPVTRVYYHYLRHQGEQATGSYQAKQWSDLSDDETSSSNVSMNFGVVRNNIYRVSIESFSPIEGTLKIRVEEKHWRHVDNPDIYL